MSDAAREPDEPAAKPADARRAAEPSFGNMGEHHWSRARAGTNAEALDYYRARSKAPGVAEGGGARNFYCMACDGVIDADAGHARCPHCDAELEGMTAQEIAVGLGLNVNTVYSRLRAARLQLEKSLGEPAQARLTQQEAR